MTLLHLRYFCVVAKHESISRAAEELCISQPALSKMIRALEEELGVDLFDRRGRQIFLNQNGSLFYESVSRAIGMLDNAVEVVTKDPNAKEIRLSVNCADLFIGDVILSYHKRHPDVLFIITNETHPENHSNTYLDDLTIFSGREEIARSPSPRQHILYTERFGLIVHKSDPLSERESIDLIEARDRRFLGTDLYGVNRLMCQEAGFTSRMIITGQNIHTYLRMLECGSGVSIAPEVSIGHYLPESCVFVPLRSPQRKRIVVLQENDMKDLAPHVKVFVRYCLDMAAGLGKG